MTAGMDISSRGGGLPSPLGEAVPTRWVIAAVCAGMVLFAMPVTLSSILVAELGKQHALNSTFGGMLIASQFLGMILGGLLVSRVISRYRLPTLALPCLLLSAMAEFASAFLLEFPAFFLASRLAVGIGCGAIYTAVLSIVGINGNAERVFGLSTALCMATLAVITAIAGSIYSSLGVRSGMIFIALLTLAFSPLLLKAPSRPASFRSAAEASERLPHLILGLLMGSGFLLGKMTLGMGAAFVVVVANAHGISTQAASAVLGLALFTGMAGSMISALISSRVSRIRGALIGLMGAMLGWSLLYGSGSAPVIYMAMFIYPFFSAFYATFLLGTANALDVQGRWAALVSPFTAGGMALGAPLGGYLIRDFTFLHVAIFLVALLAVCAMIFSIVEARIAVFQCEEHTGS